MEEISKSKTRILFIPGANMDLQAYNSLIRILRNEYNVDTIDFLKLNGCCIQDTQDKIKRYLENIEEDVYIVAHSYGADMVKDIESRNIKKQILFNSCMYDPKHSKFKVILITLTKSLLAPIKYPSLMKFYFIVNMLFIKNIIFHPFKTINHINQSLVNITTNLQVTKENSIVYPVVSKYDEYFPEITRIPEQTNLVVVQGNHDWLMSNVDETIVIINQIISVK